MNALAKLRKEYAEEGGWPCVAILPEAAMMNLTGLVTLTRLSPREEQEAREKARRVRFGEHLRSGEYGLILDAWGRCVLAHMR